MAFEQKLNIVISEITSVYELSNSQANLIKQNIINRVNMYRNINPNFGNEETKIVANNGNIGDFFINRLVTNIRNYDFDLTYNKENTLKGTYTPKEQSMYVGNYKFIEDITRDKLKNRMELIDTETLNKATLNVLNHEIGHALQTSFKGKYGKNDIKYNQLISNLVTKYPNEFKIQVADESLKSIHEGMEAVRKDDIYKEARDFYAKNAYSTHLDEIFNEDEALKVTGVDKPQIQYNIGNDFYKKIYNYQSSNYKITSYGRMMKIIMGDNLTFKAMYEDSIVAYNFFDQFKDISDTVYKEKPPMFNILNSLNEIKANSSLVESQKLDLFLTECLQRRVSHDLNNQKITLNDLNKIKMYVDEFDNYLIKNPNKITNQEYIISNIKKHIIEKQQNLKNNNAETNHFRHTKANELNELEKKKQIAKENNDKVTYNYAQANIERIIGENRLEVSPTQWDSMNIDEQIAFVKIKINESKVLRDQDEFNYWNSNLRSLEFKKNENGSIHEYHTPVYNTPKANEKSFNQEEIKMQEKEKNDLDLSGSINQLKSELNKINNLYHMMLSDEYIDDDEFAILTAMIDKVIASGYSLKEIATTQNDKRTIAIIIDTLEEEKIKMAKMQNVIEEKEISKKY